MDYAEGTPSFTGAVELSASDFTISTGVFIKNDGSFLFSCKAFGGGGRSGNEAVYISDDIDHPNNLITLVASWGEGTLDECKTRVMDNIEGVRDSVSSIGCWITDFGIEVELSPSPAEDALRNWYCVMKTADDEDQTSFSYNYKQFTIPDYAMKNLEEIEEPYVNIMTLPELSDGSSVALGCGVNNVEYPDVTPPLKFATFSNPQLGVVVTGDLYGRDSFVSPVVECSSGEDDSNSTSMDRIRTSVAGGVYPKDFLAHCYNNEPSNYLFTDVSPPLAAFVETKSRNHLYSPDNITFDLQLTDIFTFNSKHRRPALYDLSRHDTIAFKMFDVEDVTTDVPVHNLPIRVSGSVDEAPTFVMPPNLISEVVTDVTPLLKRVNFLEIVLSNNSAYTCANKQNTDLIYLVQDCLTYTNESAPAFENEDCSDDKADFLHFKHKRVSLTDASSSTHTPDCGRISTYGICLTYDDDDTRIKEIKMANFLFGFSENTNVELGSYQQDQFETHCDGTRTTPLYSESHFIYTVNMALTTACHSCSFLGNEFLNMSASSSRNILTGEPMGPIRKCSQKLNRCVGDYADRVQAMIRVPIELAAQGGEWSCEIYDLESERKDWVYHLSADLACAGTEIITPFIQPAKLIKRDVNQNVMSLYCETIPHDCESLGASPVRFLKFYNVRGESVETNIFHSDADEYEVGKIEAIKKYNSVKCLSYGETQEEEKAVKDLFKSSQQTADVSSRCYYRSGENNNQIDCYYAMSEFTNFPGFFELWDMSTGQVMDAFMMGLEARVFTPNDVVVFTSNQTTPKTDKPVLLRAYKDLSKKNIIYEEQYDLKSSEGAGTCKHGVGEEIKVDFYTNDDGTTRITCSDPDFDEPRCESAGVQINKVYFLQLMAFGGDSSEEYSTVDHSDWVTVATVYTTYGLEEDNSTSVVRDVSSETDRNHIVLYGGDWYKQFSYELSHEDIANFLTYNKSILIAQCVKNTGGLGGTVAAHKRLDYASAIYKHDLIYHPHIMTTTLFPSEDVNEIETATPKLPKSKTPLSSLTDSVRMIVLFTLASCLAVILLVTFVVCLYMSCENKAYSIQGYRMV